MVLRRLNVPGAWLAGLIFAVHPVNVESVGWITERKNVLPMVFYLVSIMLYLKYEEDKRRWIYGFSLVSFLCALLAKTSVVMLPFVILGCIWWQRGRIVSKDVLRTIPFFVLSGILGAVTIWFQYHQAIGSTVVRDDSFLSRLVGASWAIWFYIYKAVFPYKLSFVYPRWDIDDSSMLSFVPLLLLMSVLTAFWWYRKTWGRPFLFGMGYFVVTLFPVLGFLNIYFMKYSLVADHWQYTSIIGVIALFVGLGSYLCRSWSKVIRQVTILGVVILICILSLYTWKQAHIYKDGDTLWRDTVAKNPRCWLAHNNLGIGMVKKRKVREGISKFIEALRICPDCAEVHDNLATALYEIGDTKGAISHYSQALRIDPSFALGHYNLGTALTEQGRISESIKHYLEALRIKPDYEEAHHNLGIALAYQGRMHEAVLRFRETLRINPNNIIARRNLGHALMESRKLEEVLGK